MLKSIGVEVPADEFAAVRKLAEVTGVDAPESLANIEGKKVRFEKVIKPSEMPSEIVTFA